MDVVYYSLALMSGFFVLLSPCSYPLLPGYVAYYLGTKMSSQRALRGGLTCGLGLVVIYSVIGLITYSLGSALTKFLPFAHYLAAVIIALLGLSMLFGFGYPRLYLNVHASSHGGFYGLFVYGLTYGLASLACSAPVFISIMFYSSALSDILDGVLGFLFFSIGMIIPLILTALLVAKAEGLLLKRIVRATSKIQRASGLVLLGLAFYLFFLV